MKGRFDRYVSYDPLTEETVANDKFHKELLQKKETNKIGAEAVKARDEVRKSRLLIYITQVMSFEKSNKLQDKRKVV